MNSDPGLNSLLKWSVENSDVTRNDPNAPTDPNAPRGPATSLDKEALARLMGGPSDADRMIESMTAIRSPEVELDQKLIAFDNFEQLIENLDNANNMEPLKLWMPLVEELDDAESELQLMAAWCIGTAVQNNAKAQERCLVIGAIPKLTKLAFDGTTPALRKKSIFALSSEVRNYQPGMDEFLKHLPSEHQPPANLEASDMDSIDTLMNRLRETVK